MSPIQDRRPLAAGTKRANAQAAAANRSPTSTQDPKRSAVGAAAPARATVPQAQKGLFLPTAKAAGLRPAFHPANVPGAPHEVVVGGQPHPDDLAAAAEARLARSAKLGGIDAVGSLSLAECASKLNLAMFDFDAYADGWEKAKAEIASQQRRDSAAAFTTPQLRMGGLGKELTVQDYLNAARCKGRGSLSPLAMLVRDQVNFNFVGIHIKDTRVFAFQEKFFVQDEDELKAFTSFWMLAYFGADYDESTFVIAWDEGCMVDYVGRQRVKEFTGADPQKKQKQDSLRLQVKSILANARSALFQGGIMNTFRDHAGLGEKPKGEQKVAGKAHKKPEDPKLEVYSKEMMRRNTSMYRMPWMEGTPSEVPGADTSKDPVANPAAVKTMAKVFGYDVETQGAEEMKYTLMQVAVVATVIQDNLLGRSRAASSSGDSCDIAIKKTAEYLKLAFSKYDWKKQDDPPLTKFITISDYPPAEEGTWGAPLFSETADGVLMNMQEYPLAKRSDFDRFMPQRAGGTPPTGGSQ